MATNILNNINLNRNEIQNMVLQPLAVEPAVATSKLGQLYFNTVSKRVRQFNGTGWEDVGGGVISVSAATDETVISVNNTDPENPVLSFKIAATQGTGVTVSEESDGVKVAVQDGTTSVKGIVQLDDTPSSSVSTTAATPKGANVTLEELSTATTGYLKTYEIKQGGVSCGKIDIPKDFLVKNATTGTVTTADKAAGGKFEDSAKYGDFLVGDVYIDLTINVKSGTATEEHLYLLAKKLGRFTHKSTATLSAGSTSVSISLPVNSQFLNAFMLDENNYMASCDRLVTEATSSAAGSVVFSIAAAYTSDLECAVVYNV